MLPESDDIVGAILPYANASVSYEMQDLKAFVGVDLSFELGDGFALWLEALESRYHVNVGSDLGKRDNVVYEVPGCTKGTREENEFDEIHQ